jgi:2,3-bisphosphoglycerate-independent phosphoglycerate mutase
MGLVSDGGVHSHIDHLKALCDIAEEQGCASVYVHAFTDGRDCDPKVVPLLWKTYSSISTEKT